MDTNALLQRWSGLSFDEIEDEIVLGKDHDSVTQLLGPETVAEIRGISFAAPSVGMRPDVVLLPGIMGSNLASIRGVTSLLWINPLMFLKGNARFLRLNADGSDDDCSEVECMPVGLEKLTYLKIGLLLNRQANLHEFPYDWRRPIEYNADLLHTALERWSGGDPGRQFTLVAHSMGGLVSRAYMARHPESAQKRVRRLIMHGTPNFGAANAVDNLINGNSMAATADKLNQSNEMRQLIYGLPSVYQLLPVPESLFPAGHKYPFDFDLYDASAWGLPAVQQKYLDAALRFHQALASAEPQTPVSIIAGCNVETAVGADMRKENGASQLIPEMMGEGDNSGDGTVPLWSARLPGADIYYIQEVHRNLPNNGEVIRATMELLHSDRCDLPVNLPARKKPLISFDAPFSTQVQAEDLRAKIESGTATDQDLKQLYFAF